MRIANFSCSSRKSSDMIFSFKTLAVVLSSFISYCMIRLLLYIKKFKIEHATALLTFCGLNLKTHKTILADLEAYSTNCE
jgi:hypothetical protein